MSMPYNYDLTTVSSSTYSTFYTHNQRDYYCGSTHITPSKTLSSSPADDSPTDPYLIFNELNNDNNDNCKPLREKNSRKFKTYKHIPHKDKPASVVARRNARERRRVQAVNRAFMRLRKAVPIDNTRGKRVSKVKTLQYAIHYIYSLQKILEQDNSNQGYSTRNNFFNDYEIMEPF